LIDVPVLHAFLDPFARVSTGDCPTDSCNLLAVSAADLAASQPADNGACNCSRNLVGIIGRALNGNELIAAFFSRH
jgi:hypothetical protein